ncbi:MAG: hypothetical protein ABI925_09375 [Verrucomicrobiota bacterium]
MKRRKHHLLVVAISLITNVAALAQDKSAIVQPNYEAWKLVSNGMTEVEVIQILGKPESGLRLEEMGQDRSGTTAWHYWTLYPRSKVFPGGVHFLVWMKEGKVFSKSDPHGGDSSLDGKPTVPRLCLPQDKTQFTRSESHIVDLRWLPSAGQCPMIYDVELDLSTQDEPGGPERWFTQTHTPADEPYLAVGTGGVQPHRWRVRARNALGISDWSNYFYFEIGQ